MKVLVAPLNWGLGHATRDIPIIKLLLENGAEVVLAGDGAGLKLLRGEFPDLPYYELPGWNITYPENGSFAWHLIKQTGKVLRAIRLEHQAVETIVREERIDVVISDNRLGAFSKSARNIVISHQIFLESPIIKRFLNWNNTRLLKKFDEVWVVDVPGDHNLSGRLSHRKKIPFKHRYLGIISRFSGAQKEPADEVEVLAIVSGPEPQRTLFEKELLPELEKMGKKTVVLLGKPGEPKGSWQQGKLTLYNHLTGVELAHLFAAAETVISRDGYTTVMDLVVLNKKAVLVPTPGQTEQEYLADYYQEKGWYVIQRQGKIDLEKAFRQLPLSQIPTVSKENTLEKAVKSLFKS